MESLEKRSNNSLYGNSRYETETIDQYEIYKDDDIPMSAEEKALVRKIDFFLMPLICTIDFLQVKFILFTVKTLEIFFLNGSSSINSF